MKKILYTFFLFVFLIAGVGAEYNPDKPVDNNGPSTRIMTTSIDYSDTSKNMHQSWDLNLDSLNDCENDGTCDDSVDYTKAKTYSNSTDFLEAEGQICKQATDGCNSVGIWDGQLGAMTMMYCEDIYGKKGAEKWSCNLYDEEKINHMKYIKKNISDLSNKKTVLGGTWYVTNIDWKSDREIIVNYEDGHITEKFVLSLDFLKQSQIEKKDENRACTLEHAPVCAEVHVQCIKSPCYPIEQTFGNACMAGEKKILYKGECSSYIDYKVYDKYKAKEYKFIPILEKFSDDKLNKLLELIEQKIETTKLLRFAKWMQQEKITAYIFLRDLINKEFQNR